MAFAFASWVVRPSLWAHLAMLSCWRQCCSN